MDHHLVLKQPNVYFKEIRMPSYYMYNEIHDLERLIQNSEPIADYVSSIIQGNRSLYENKSKNKIDLVKVNELRKYADENLLFVFSAEWCSDCMDILPILNEINRLTELKIRVFNKLMRDPKNPKVYWRIPPSPLEAEEFKIRRIPAILVFDVEGRKKGEIIEKPPEGITLEENLLEIMHGC
jgi:thiol-disulfide isomerase/thioredoxin